MSSENAKSAERRRSSFIPTQGSKRYGPFAPGFVVELATKTPMFVLTAEVGRLLVGNQ
jgi:hypothetical protein